MSSWVSAAATGAVRGDRPSLARAGRRPAWDFYDRRLFSARLASLGVDRAGIAFPSWDESGQNALAARPRQARRTLVAFAVFSVVFLAFTIVEYRYGILQHDRDGRGGLIDAVRDPTLDLYGWDQVAREIHSRGLVENPGTFLFTRYWYQAPLDPPWMGSILSSAITPTTLAVLRSGASPTTGSVMTGSSWSSARHEAMARYYQSHWFSRVEPVSDFWVEHHGKPVRRIGIYRCIRQRVAYPFTRDSETRLARNARRQAP